ncbi:MAG: phosphoribosyltransferase family protein [Patescibacteria group bacterium]
MERLDEAKIRQILDDARAVIADSHFVYSKPEGHGDHGPAYINKDAVYVDSVAVSKLCYELAHRVVGVITQRPTTSYVIVGPEKGGLILSTWLSFWLTQLVGSCFPSVYAEKTGGDRFELRRGYDKIVGGKNVIVVEDILNSGRSAEATCEAVRRFGGCPIIVAALCNRGGVTAKGIGVPHLEVLLNVKMDKFAEGKCPICDAKQIPVRTDLGHGAAFLARQTAAA